MSIAAIYRTEVEQHHLKQISPFELYVLPNIPNANFFGIPSVCRNISQVPRSLLSAGPGEVVLFVVRPLA